MTTTSLRRATWLRVAAVAAAVVCASIAGRSTARATTGVEDTPTVAVTEVRGAITPVVADHLRDVVAQAATDGYQALIVELDTPGGLVTSMRTIVQSFLEADLPVVVYVAPRGADAGSAGTFVTLAAHVAAMAPATTIGAATPVDLEGGEVGDKIVNNAAAYAQAVAEERGRNVEFAVDAVREGRSITSHEAVDIGAVDLIADDLQDLLAQLDGRTVELADGTSATLRTADAARARLEMSGVRRILQRLADPNLAFLFISIGTLALLYEFANPGVGAGGIVGAVMLVLAMVALSVLPVNLAGAALLVLAVGLFVAELFVPGIGVLAAGGTVALVLGGLLLFQRPTGIGVDLVVLVPTALVAAIGAVLLARLAARTRSAPSVGGTDVFLGRTVQVARADGATGRGQLDGTWWRLRSADGSALQPGADVRVVDTHELDLIVEPPEEEQP